MKIYLIGMPGCGKSTVGRKIAKKLNISLFDTDQIISQEHKTSVKKIFASNGESYFRKCETDVLKRLQYFDDAVISTGGGIILNKENKKYMNGLIIYLDLDLNILKQRLENDHKRPLLTSNTIDDLYNQRKDLYNWFAHEEYKTSHALVESVIKRHKR